MNNCFLSADILIPDTDLEKWSVIACDQYTSEPEYWNDAENIAGDSLSALNLIFPEVYLGKNDDERIAKINANMEAYLSAGIFKEYKQSYIYVERTQNDGRVRKGIVGMIDLDCYDYSPDSKSAIRSTEKTVVSRIPARVNIRKNAVLELPHVMLLADDDQNILIGEIEKNKANYKVIYDFTLMKNGGEIKGMLIDKAGVEIIKNAVAKLSDKHNGLVFCVGDGNHSLAAAKECSNINKTELSRYALAEVVNIHDTALDFEPIYRVVFGVDPKALIESFKDYCKGTSGSEKEYMCVYGDNTESFTVTSPEVQSVATLQSFLDEYIKGRPEITVDYIHGEDSLKKLSRRENTVGFMFKGIDKKGLFESVERDGSLPRKTFSMGHADDKRFYLEARKIK